MSRRAESPELELRLIVSPPRSPEVEPPSNMSPWWEVSVGEEGSCVSSERSVNWQSSPEEDTAETATAMLLVGCPRCLMYVMLRETEPKCPRCKSTVLLDFLKKEQSVDKKEGS